MIDRILKRIRRPKVDLAYVDPEFLRRIHKRRDWSGETFENFVPVGCAFESCSFERCDFVRACFGGGLEDSRYVDCSFDGSTIRAIAAGNARFESCTFQEVDIVEFYGFAVEMVNCTISGTVRKGFCNGTVPSDVAEELGRTANDFYGNDFSAARLIDFDFRTGIELARQKLPDGWQPDI